MDRSLQKMSRLELLEILRSQEEEIDALRHEITQLQSRIEDKTQAVDKALSIAEAALAVNKAFVTVQDASQQYLSYVQRIIDEDTGRFVRMRDDAEKHLEDTRRETERSCMEREERERQYVDQLWISLEKKLDDYGQAHPESKPIILAEIRKELHTDRFRTPLSGEEAI